MKFDDKYFIKFNFSKDQINKNLNNAAKDLDIAKRDQILEVKFNYAYTSLLKGGIALLSFYGQRARSVPGHHIKVIDIIADILNDDTVSDIGNIMRSKRNKDLYAGGIEIGEKECFDYIEFVEDILGKISKIIKK